MIPIELRSSNVSVSLSLRAHVVRKLDFALRRFTQHVDRAVVRLSDVNGPKGGPDKRCRILLRLRTGEELVVEATDEDAYDAATKAAIRLDEAVSRAISRHRVRPLVAQRRSPAPVWVDGDDPLPAS